MHNRQKTLKLDAREIKFKTLLAESNSFGVRVAHKRTAPRQEFHVSPNLPQAAKCPLGRVPSTTSPRTAAAIPRNPVPVPNKASEWAYRLQDGQQGGVCIQ